MIRITLLMFMVAFFSIYAWKEWFVSLCVVILTLAVVQQPDFPNAIGGIQGANPWNILMLSILFAWIARRGEEGYEWDLPSLVSWMLFAGLSVVVVGVLRLLHNDYPGKFTTGTILSEDLVNTIKWVVPSLLLFDACRTRRRIVITLGVILALYFLLAIQVIRWMPLSSIGSGDDLASRASRITQNEIGYNRVTLSMMLSGASWATLTAIPILKSKLHCILLFIVASTIVFGQALTGGRTGYLSWVLVGILLSALRWRRLIFVIPLALIIAGFVIPGVFERMFQGFGSREGNFVIGTSAYEMTSGRDIAWPVVIEEIRKAPLIGYGRESMITTGISDHLLFEYGESFPHPHHAYLQLLLDNGVIGFMFVIPIFFYVLTHSVLYVMERNDPLVCAIGCTSFCLVLALMIGSFGGQTFYPREGSVGMWVAIALFLRVHVNTRLAKESGDTLFPDKLPSEWFFNNVNEKTP